MKNAERKQEIEVALKLIVSVLNNFSLSIIEDGDEGIKVLDVTNGNKYLILQED